jgi:ABC-type lipoprotein release transport system permease subunit
MLLALDVAVVNGGRAWLGSSYSAETGKSFIAETQRAQKGLKVQSWAEQKKEADLF